MLPKYHTAPTHCETCSSPLHQPNYHRRRFCSKRCSNIRRWLTEVEIWERIDQSKGLGACWPWMGGTDKNGYGKTHWKGKPIRTHRLIYILTYTHIPELLVRHTCDNPPCCNPSHLMLGTHQDNANDKVARSRQPRGIQVCTAKITEQAVLTMRRAVSEGMSLRTAAKTFGYSSISAVASAVYGETWGWVPGAIPKGTLALQRNAQGQFQRSFSSRRSC